MKKRSWLVAGLAVAALISALTSPAYGYAGLTASAEQAASIDDLKASDAQLVQAIGTLNQQVSGQQAELDSANQALNAANQTVNNDDAAIGVTQQRIDGLKGVAQARAVEDYMAPRDDMMTKLLSSKGFDDASRANELLDEINDNDFNALDELKAAKTDLSHQRKAADDARTTATSRRLNAQKQLDSLNSTLADKTKLDQSLQARISADAGEDSASAQGQAASAAGRASRGGDGTDDDTRVSAAGLQWPIHGNHAVTSPFGERWGRMHEGIDIGAPNGTPVYAAKSGTVTYAGTASGYGDYICINHGDGFSTCYAHEGSIGVKVGQQVNQGDKLGSVGTTGDATGPNLHFETCTNGVPACFDGSFKNPMNYLP